MQAATQIPVSANGQQSPAPAPVQVVANEPVFLRENWKRVIGTHCDDPMKYVRIVTGVANVTNGKVLLRCPINLPDGFYTLNARNELVMAEYREFLHYPDVEGARQPFERMQWSQPIPYQMVGEAREFCSNVGHKHGYIVVDKHGFVMKQNTDYFFDFARRLGFELPIGGDEVSVDPVYLYMALTEMLRYPHVYLSRDNKIDRKTPLVLGLDWGRCALVMPVRGWY